MVCVCAGGAIGLLIQVAVASSQRVFAPVGLETLFEHCFYARLRLVGELEPENTRACMHTHTSARGNRKREEGDDTASICNHFHFPCVAVNT